VSNASDLILYIFKGYALCDAIYRTPIINADEGVGQALHFASIDCERSLAVRGGPFFQLSMEFFMSLLGGVLTYFIVLVQFNE
jgi:hypothetical protein